MFMQSRVTLRPYPVVSSETAPPEPSAEHYALDVFCNYPFYGNYCSVLLSVLNPAQPHNAAEKDRPRCHPAF